MVTVEFRTQNGTTTKTFHMHCLINLLEYGGVYDFKMAKTPDIAMCEWFNCGSALETPENDDIRRECVKKPAEYLKA